MGAGASLPGEQAELFQKLSKTYEEKKEAGGDSKDQELEIFNALKNQFDMLCSTPANNGNRKNRKASLSAPLNKASSDALSLCVGDIVEAQPKGMKLYCEAVIVDLCDDGTYEVDFGEGEDIELIPAARIRRALAWDTLEIGDRVKVRY